MHLNENGKLAVDLKWHMLTSVNPTLVQSNANTNIKRNTERHKKQQKLHA